MNLNVNYDNIPAELRALTQWMAFHVFPNPDKPGKYSKIPYIAQIGIDAKAKSTDPATWRTFETALAFTQQSPETLFLGLALTANDPYCVVDFDATTSQEVAARHTKIMTHFGNTYQERSISGTGFHVICKAPPIAGVNCKAESMEVYTKERMLVFTGDVTVNQPIMDRSEDIAGLVEHLYSMQVSAAKERVEYKETKSHLTPEQVLMVLAKSHHEKSPIRRLVMGGFNKDDFKGSDGVADFSGTTGRIMVALCAESGILDKNLLKLAFFQTAWFKSPLYKQHYIETSNIHKNDVNHRTHWERETVTAIGKAQLLLARKLQEQNLGTDSATNLLAAFKQQQEGAQQQQIAHAEDNTDEAHASAREEMLSEEVQVEEVVSEADNHGIPVIQAPEDHWQYPPGKLLDQMVTFFMEVSHRPNRAVCVASAITTLSGWTGSRFQTNTGAGLTFFALLFGKSGIGKSDCQTAYRSLTKGLKLDAEDAAFAEDFLGKHTVPGRQTGGAAVRRHLGDIYETNNNCVSVSMFQEEAGHVISGAMRNGSNSKDFIDLIYDMFTSAGQSMGLASKLYVNDENTVEELESANLAYLGEGTKESIFENLSIEDLDKGLFPRFCYVECGDKKPRGNKFKKQPEDIPDSLRELCLLTMKEVRKLEDRRIYRVIQATGEAQDWLNKFEDAVDDYTDRLEDIDPARTMYNRHHLITLRLACLAAISKNCMNPIIDMECIKWAQAFTNNSIRVVLQTMHEEKMNDFGKRGISMAKILLKYLDSTTINKKAKSEKRISALIDKGFIRWSDVCTNIAKYPGFREAEATKFKNVPALAREVLAEFENMGILEKVEPMEVRMVVSTAKGGLYYRMTTDGYSMIKQIAKDAN